MITLAVIVVAVIVVLVNNRIKNIRIKELEHSLEKGVSLHTFEKNLILDLVLNNKEKEVVDMLKD